MPVTVAPSCTHPLPQAATSAITISRGRRTARRCPACPAVICSLCLGAHCAFFDLPDGVPYYDAETHDQSWGRDVRRAHEKVVRRAERRQAIAAGDATRRRRR